MTVFPVSLYYFLDSDSMQYVSLIGENAVDILQGLIDYFSIFDDFNREFFAAIRYAVSLIDSHTDVFTYIPDFVDELKIILEENLL